MAQKVLTIRVSDLSGEELGDEGQTINFSIGSDAYSIDLSDEEAGSFFDALKPYMDVASKTGGRGVRRSSSSRSTTSDGPAAKDVKAWADKQGLDYPKRGRLPRELVDQYLAAN
jgi:hypothetical protein